jgi:hypothetical protein
MTVVFPLLEKVILLVDIEYELDEVKALSIVDYVG